MPTHVTEPPSEYYSLVEPPGYEVPGMTRQYKIRTWRSDVSLAERTRSLTNILGAEVTEVVNEHLLEAAIQSNLGDLLPMIGERIGSERIGYLVRVNLYRDPTDGVVRPTTQLLSAIGPGFEPVDALAESYRTGSINTRPPDAVLVRRYMWCTRDGDGLNISCPDVALGDRLEAEAATEARRRHLLGARFATQADHTLKRVERAQKWQRLVQQRADQIKGSADRARLDALTRAFAAAQDRFNDAFESYQVAERELAAAAREARLISGITSVMSLLRTGYEMGTRMSLKESENPEAAARWREHQIEVLGKARLRAEGEISDLLPGFEALEIELREELKRLQVPVPGELETWALPNLRA